MLTEKPALDILVDPGRQGTFILETPVFPQFGSQSLLMSRALTAADGMGGTDQ
jgi:hypothetical protein